MPKTAKLTVRLPQSELDFIRAYVAEHGISLTSLVTSYFQQLQQQATKAPIHPTVKRFSGILPAKLDVRAEFRKHQERRLS
jgi:hypothetical protein